MCWTPRSIFTRVSRVIVIPLELDFSNEFRLSHSLRYSYFPNIFPNTDLILLYLCIHHTFSNRWTNFGPFFTLFYD